MTKENLSVEPQVLITETKEHIANVTIRMYDESHKFELWKESDKALLEYQETLSHRFEIKVSDPDEDIYRALMTSEEMTSLLNRWDVSGVRRAAPTP